MATLKLYAKNQLEYKDLGYGYNCDYEFPIKHTHDYWEFFYVLYDLEHFINGKIEHLNPNTIYIIKPNDVHYISAVQNKLNPDKAPTLLNIKVTNESLHNLLDSIDSDLLDRIDKSEDLFIELGDSVSSKLLKSYMRTLLWEQDIDKNIIILKNVILTIVTSLYQKIYKDVDTFDNKANEIESIIERMNYRKNFTKSIKDLVSSSSYSYMQITRLFKKTTGLSMQEYFLNVKMNYAANRLILTNDLISNIANEIGISSLSHFNSMFKEKYGVTPGKYRKTIIKK